MIDIVFFDAGETILHPHPSFPELFSSVCTRFGYDVSAQRVAGVQDRIAPHLVELLEDSGVEQGPSLSPSSARQFWTYLYRRFLSELGIEDEALANGLFDTFSDSGSYKLFDDVLDCLGELHAAGYRLGIISNFERWLEEMLIELEVGHLFEVKVISELAGVEKPDVAIYDHALAQSGADPSRSVHVGDSPSNDAAPATAAGIHAVLLDRVGRYEDSPWQTIGSLKELRGVIENL